MDFTFDKRFKISSHAMKINKCHPDIKRDLKWLLHFTLTHGVFTLVFLIVMYNIIFINLKNRAFDDTCRNGVLGIVYFVISFEHLVMNWKINLIAKLIALMERDYDRAKFLPMEEQKIMDKYIIKGAHVTKQWLVLSVSGALMFPLKNVVLLIYNWAIGEPKLIPIMDLVYPNFIEENKNNIFVYLATYVLLLYYASYSTCMYIAFVPLCPIFMTHMCGQLEIVEKRIEVLFQGNLEEAEVKLKEIIKHLQYIYSFVDQIELIFRVNYECTLKETAILLPVTLYEIIEVFHNGDFPLEFISLIIGGTLISSTPCYYSDLLMEKGENVRIAMYSCGWETIPNLRIRSTIRIVMMRALKPVAIRTLFRPICLETFADILQQSYALFNLMNSMWK